MDVHLYGRLRRYAPQSRRDRDSVVRPTPRPEETVRTLLERLGIAPEEVAHVFVDGQLLLTHNGMAPWLGYPQAQPNAADRVGGLDTPLRSVDRVGLFGRDMALLVV
jgi:hypothetical protein